MTQQARRLLLIDDSLSVRRVVSRLLERAGYQVVTASDGQEALDLLRQDPHFQAILTDLEMPRVNGFEVIEDVRRRDASVPIIVMTTRPGKNTSSWLSSSVPATTSASRSTNRCSPAVWNG